MNPVRSTLNINYKIMSYSTVRLSLMFILLNLGNLKVFYFQGMNPVRGRNSQVSLINSVSINLDHVTPNHLLLTKVICL